MSPDPALAVRPARPDDVARLGAIEVAAGDRFRAVGMAEVADDPPWPAEAYLAAVVDGRVWVAELDGVVVGYAAAASVGDEPHLEQVSVVPEAGGRGVGVALVDAVADWGRGRGGRRLTLTTFRSVPWNAPWYERLGFREVPEEAWGAAVHLVVDHEASMGFDPGTRVVMARDLGPA